MRACVYVDAFNLYYGCLKGTPHRWLDIRALCEREFAGLQIEHIHVFTARVRNRPGDPTQATRQQIYFRALATVPGLTLHFGRYVEHPTRMALETPPPGGPNTVSVIKSEEKGSDVNLASHLLLGAFRNEFEVGIVLSNDTDLKEPIRIVTHEFRKPVFVLAPLRALRPGQPLRYIARDLINVATFAVPLDHALLPQSQLSAHLADATGTFTKPPSW